MVRHIFICGKYYIWEFKIQPENKAKLPIGYWGKVMFHDSVTEKEAEKMLSGEMSYFTHDNNKFNDSLVIFKN